KAINEAGADGVDDIQEHHRHSVHRLLQCYYGRGAASQDDIGRECDQFRRIYATAVGIESTPTVVDPHVATDGPAQLLQTLRECGDAGRCFRIVRGQVQKHADAPYALALLRARRQRPRRRAAEQRDELSAPHSITSSAVARSVDGTSSPSALAVLRLITVWCLIGNCTGRSAAFSPLRIPLTYPAARRYSSKKLGP